MRFYLILLFLPIVVLSQLQNFLSKSEVGIFGGASYYIGDLNTLAHFKNSEVAFGIIAKY
jgi:hypothetical protein